MANWLDKDFLNNNSADSAKKALPKQEYQEFLDSLEKSGAAAAATQKKDNDVDLLERYKNEGFEHFKIKEYNFDEVKDSKPYEVDFDAVYDVNAKRRRKTPVIKKVFRDRKQSILFVGDVFKSKFDDK